MASAGESTAPVAEREFLRHTLATLVYRGAKALRDAPDGFEDLQTAKTTRTPGQILAHIGDLLDWALSMARNTQQWHDSERLSWEDEIYRFFNAAKSLDDYLASG